VERREGEFRRQAGAQTREAVRQPGLRHLSELGSTARSRVENIRQVTWCQGQPGRSLRRRPSHQPSGAPLTLPWAREVSPGRGGGSRPGGEGWHKNPEPVAGSRGRHAGARCCNAVASSRCASAPCEASTCGGDNPIGVYGHGDCEHRLAMFVAHIDAVLSHHRSGATSGDTHY
jgi:hypothetical protein